jgi:hypothetical protein
MSNQRKLNDNRGDLQRPDRRGAARQGHALLQGLVLCGKCGHKMTVSYQGKLDCARYECRAPLKSGSDRSFCWTVMAERIDEAVTKLFLDTVQPPEIELGLAVLREAEQQAAEIDQQWTLRLDRAQYEARLAERRYKAVDPDNRVVARTLEGEWNNKLRELELAKQEHQRVRQMSKVDLTELDRSRILALAKDLMQVWTAETTTHAERKNLLRMLVEQVTLSPIDVPSRMTRVQLLWRTGAISDFTVPRPSNVEMRPSTMDVIPLIRELIQQQKSDEQIAASLNQRGLRNARHKPWNADVVRGVRERHGIQRSEPPRSQVPPAQRSDGLYSIHGVAALLEVTESTVRYWIKKGWIKPADGGGLGCTSWFELDPATIARLQSVKLSHIPKSRPHTPNHAHKKEHHE